MNYKTLARPTLFSMLLLAVPLASGCVAEVFSDSGHDCDDDSDFRSDFDDDDDSDDNMNVDNCPADDSAIYLSKAREICDGIEFSCPDDHTSFNQSCGCGCEPIPANNNNPPVCPTEDGEGITVLSRDLKVCTSITFSCPEGEDAFNGTCGCGCIAPGSNTNVPTCPDATDPKVHYLGDEGSVQCTMINFSCPAECVQFNDACGCGCIEP